MKESMDLVLITGSDIMENHWQNNSIKKDAS
jgi:hypothetical protein